MTKATYLFLLIILFLIFIPSLWSENLKFDIAVFTEEWYKGIFSLFQLWIAFYFFNYLIQKHSINECQDRIVRYSDKIKKNIPSIIADIEKIKYKKSSNRTKFESKEIIKRFIIFDNNLGLYLDSIDQCKNRIKISSLDTEKYYTLKKNIQLFEDYLMTNKPLRSDIYYQKRADETLELMKEFIIELSKPNIIVKL